MSSTNKTTNLELSQFLGSDSPKWLTDYNADMEKIDAGYQTVKAQADATDLVVGGHTSSISTLQDTVTSQGTAITGLRTDVTANSGSINTINSLIGNGEPTTTDKTIIGAINELAAEIPSPTTQLPATNVSYTNTTSGLTATNVQAAIDEVNAKIPASSSVDADDVTYNNTQSGLTATDVQSAIDELANSSSTSDWVQAFAYANVTTSGTTFTLPTTAKEVLILAGRTGVVEATGVFPYSVVASPSIETRVVFNDNTVLQVTLSVSGSTATVGTTGGNDTYGAVYYR